ncbi:solute carrier family 25 member 35-like isoform X2 [Sitodiplosis mosellana]|nr:solute carrier family 25 member 35-like isoform X2 [Sitodiplosis mosellana]XP_055320379.1 solute carrier family 25 member 35-like isoform X2 [Sitodiplosis mosellana]
MDFFIAGTAATCAGFFSNPFDVIKTRQQLQGELQKEVKAKNQLYRSGFTAIKTIIKSEGITGLQKGLAPALAFQFVMNSTRLGMYETVDKLNWTRFSASSHHSTVLCVFWGGVCGVVGSAIGCPLYMVKTQLQAQSSQGQFAVGTQHGHTGMLNALTNIYRHQGIRGLWRGFEGIVSRTAVGSAIQLTSFTISKDYLNKIETFKHSTFLTPLAASLISGIFLSIGMTPFDVVATRLFNQGVDQNGKGVLYRNIFDCFVKTYSIEGIHGLYKGFIANYCRCAPHTILSLTFWDLFKKWENVYLSDDSFEYNNTN